MPKENPCGRQTAMYLLELLGILPKEDKEGEDEEREDDSNDDEASNKEEEEVDDNDPFFEPDRHLIIDQLGQKHR